MAKAVNQDSKVADNTVSLSPVLKKFQVELPFNPTLVVEAIGWAEAELEYQKQLGIISTSHRAKVMEVTE